MDAQKLKAKRAQRRRFRVRKAIYGTPQKPRLSVFRSNLHIYAQLIDDLNGVTLAAASRTGSNAGNRAKTFNNVDLRALEERVARLSALWHRCPMAHALV